MFIQKLREKRQTPEQQKQAAHVLSLFFESQPKKRSESGKRDTGEPERIAIPISPIPLSVSPLKVEKADSSFPSREGKKEMDGSAGGKGEWTGHPFPIYISSLYTLQL